MAKQKKQHTIPKSYLSAWIEPVTPTGQSSAIWRITKDRSEKRRRSPAKSFTETDRYTIHLRNGERDLSVENTLGRTEFDFQDVLRAVRRKLPLTLTQKAKLSVFTAAMLGRCTRQGDHWKQQWDSHVEKIKRIERRYVAEGALMSDQLVEANQDSHARLVINTIATCAPILFAMNLTILTADDRLGFITSDAPAVMYNPRAHTLSPLYRSPGLKYPDVEITLPLSPKYTALFTHKPIGSFYLPLEQRLINEVNRTTYFHCENEFVSRTGDWDDVWFEEREMPVDAWERQQSRFVEE